MFVWLGAPENKYSLTIFCGDDWFPQNQNAIKMSFDMVDDLISVSEARKLLEKDLNKRLTDEQVQEIINRLSATIRYLLRKKL